MSILVVGSVALDTIETPAGRREDLLGGSATHFAMAASYFSPVRVVAVVGEDLEEERLACFRGRRVDLRGVQRVPGRTFRWSGRYADDCNQAQTLDTQLNVFAEFRPVLPEGWAETPVLFLANIDPELQAGVLDQMREPRLVAADTMNYWIGSKPEALRRMLGRVGLMFINDAEIRQLTGERHVLAAAEIVLGLGPSTVVIKRGEHGVWVVGRNERFALPGFPLPRVVDPTGAGDAFAGGFLGYLASRSASNPEQIRRAAVVGSVIASFQVEAFSLERVMRLELHEIRERYEAFAALTRFGDLDRDCAAAEGSSA